MSRAVVVTHLVGLVGWLGLAAVFFGLGLHGCTRRTVYDTVHLGAFAAVGIMFYCALFEVVRMFTPVKWGLRRRQEIHTDYVEAQGVSDGVTTVVAGVPRLTMESVWSLVYGLGMAFFVAIYCFTSQQPVCYYCFSLGLVVLCVDEASVMSHDCNKCFPYLVAMTMAALSVLMVVADLGFEMEDTDTFGVFGGLVLPATAPMLFWFAKTNRRYTLGGVIEMCEFGMPFASIVGLLYIWLMDGQEFQQLSEAYRADPNGTRLYDYADPGLLLTGAASPWLLVPCVVFFTGAVLQNRTVDPLVAIAIVMAVQHLVTSPDSSLSVCAALLAATAAGVRVFSVETTPPPPAPRQADEAYVDDIAI